VRRPNLGGFWPPNTPKQPAPKHGVRVGKAGRTWWGQRWLTALTGVLGADAGRLARGKTYARAGRTHDFEVKGGAVTAQVTGSRAEPYLVELRLRQLTSSAWEAAVAARRSVGGRRCC
jgi:uncharacterized Zn finger protein